MVDVDARLPLALLEAVRRQDTPEDWLPDENPAAVFPHRLGLSHVIDGQVRKFHRLARRRRRVDEAQVEALVELIARRRDATQIFAAAGRRLARYYFVGLPGLFRRLSRRLPRRLRQPALVRTLRAANGTFLVAEEVAVDKTPLQVRARGTLTECQGRGDPHCVWTVLTDGSQSPARDREPLSEPQCSSLGST